MKNIRMRRSKHKFEILTCKQKTCYIKYKKENNRRDDKTEEGNKKRWTWCSYLFLFVVLVIFSLSYYFFINIVYMNLVDIVYKTRLANNVSWVKKIRADNVSDSFLFCLLLFSSFAGIRDYVGDSYGSIQDRSRIDPRQL